MGASAAGENRVPLPELLHHSDRSSEKGAAGKHEVGREGKEERSCGGAVKKLIALM